ncbi:MAG: hypothetical protein R3332_05450 [Pseudohongiellaceae bacterium]|nr:hypothetical protein [Pseudohongiellaceae bacterium]
MRSKSLIIISAVVTPVLLLVVFSNDTDVTDNVEQTGETFVERATRTRLNVDTSRLENEDSNETLLERAQRTRASELLERADSMP